MSIEYDFLKIKSNQQLQKHFQSESILFSNLILKINKYSITQERIIVITNKAIYNLKKENVKRRIEINKLIGITISKSSNEFVIHGNDNEYDYHYISQSRYFIIKILCECYCLETKLDLLFSEMNMKSLKTIVTKKEEKKKVNTRMNMKYLSNIHEYIISNDPAKSFNKNESLLKNNVSLNNFILLKVLGRGMFGKVVLVENIETKELFAMKCIKKSLLIEENRIESTLLEKKILSEVDHPFILNLHYCFQDDYRVYFVLPFVSGGELFQHIKKFGVFNEEKYVGLYNMNIYDIRYNIYIVYIEFFSILLKLA